MEPRFNINRPPVSDEEIEKHKDFDSLVAQFKKQSLKKARGDESWWKNRKVQYSTVILGITVVCTITYLSIIKNPSNLKHTNDKISTSKTSQIKSARPTAAYVKSQVPKLDKKTTVYKVNNQRGAELRHHTSSKISVPKNSFVDKQGKEIVGDITLEYREFENLADVIACGIPMRHDSLGKPFQLESAGMFELKGNVNGEPVFVNPSKPIKVELASPTAENRFLQYYLDTITRNWRYLGPDVVVKAASAPPAQQPVALDKVRQLEYETTVLLARKKDSLETFYTTAVKKIPGPKAPPEPRKKTGRPVFSLESNLNEFPELAAFKNVMFEVGPENKNYSSEFHDITWSDIKISDGPVKGKNYFLDLSYRKQNERLIVYPVLSGTNYEEAKEKYSERLQEYKELVVKMEAREQALLAELRNKQDALARELAQKQEALRRARAAESPEQMDAKFSNLSASAKAKRVFDVVRFGIYNSDCPHAITDARLVQPGFVEATNKSFVNPEAVYLIDHTLKTVSASDARNSALSILPGNLYSICVIERGIVFTCGKGTFKESMAAGKNIFPVSEQKGAADNITDFLKALEI